MKKANRVWAGFVPLLKVTFPLIALLSLYAVAVSCYHKSASLTAANQILSSALGWGFNASEDASLAVLAEELRTANRELKLLREDHGNMLTSLAGIGKGLESRSDSKTGFELETGSGAQSGATSEKESGDAETVAQLQVELETLRRKMDDVMAVGNTPLTPMSLARSELVFPPNPPVTGKPYTLTLHAKSIRGNDISTGGVELYARLTGPALVAADVEDFRNGSYELTFLPPLEGEYVLDFVLFYEHYDRSVRKWEATDFSGEFVKGCMYQCHDSGDSDTGPGGEKAELYANCMNICREYSSGPALRDERRREEGVKIVGDFEYIKPDAPFCGIDVPVDDDGWWVNRTLVCPEGDAACLQNLVYCSPEQYADPHFAVCNLTLVWRPLTCRHVYWQALSPPPVPSAQKALERARASKDYMLFCGDSTTHEIYEIIHNRHQSLTTKNIYGDVNRPTCFEETPDVFVTGGCGSNSAQVSIVRMGELTKRCRKEVPKLKAMSDKVPLIHRTGPAAFPYLGAQIEPQIAPSYDIGQRFHGQRNWLTNAQMRLFNQMVREELTAGGVKFVDWDEFKMTYPLWGFHIDALHWGHDAGFGQTLGNTLMSVYMRLGEPGKKV